MRVKEIMDLAKINIDDGITLRYARIWINDCLNDLATRSKSARILDTVEIVAEKNKWYDLPINLISIESVEKDKNQISDFRLNANKIKFLKDGTYEVEYKRPAKNVALESDSVEVHPLFKPAISLYLASKEKARFNPDDPDTNRLMAEYVNRVYETDIALSAPKKNRVMKVRPYM